MATWNEIKSFLHSRYKFTDLNEDVLKGEWALDDGRSQVLIVVRQNDSRITLEAPVATYTPEAAIRLLEGNQSVFGVDLREAGEDRVLILTDPQVMDSIDEAELDPLPILLAADKLEREIFGTDIY